MSFFDSGAADLGTSVSGGATGGLQGYIEGLQLGDQREKHALEMEQVRRALKNPHITALAHGAYLQQDPVTGEVKEHQGAGAYPGGIQNYLMHQFFKNPENPLIHKAMGFVFGHSPEQIAAQIAATTALVTSRKSQADSTRAYIELLNKKADFVQSTKPLEADLIRNRIEYLKAQTAHQKSMPPGGNPMTELQVQHLKELSEADPNWMENPILREEGLLWMRQPEYNPGMTVEPTSRFTGERKEKPAAEPGLFQKAYENLAGKQKPTGPTADPERRKKADEFILSKGYLSALQAKKTGKLPNGALLTPDDKLALDEAIAVYTKEHAGR